MTFALNKVSAVRMGAVAAMALVFTPAWAHHSFGQFDMQKSVTIQGTVKDFQWANPHVWIDLNAVNPATRKPTAFSVEADSVSLMTRKGWTRNSLRVGDKISISLHPLKNGQVGGSLISATVNGRTIGGLSSAHP